MELISYIAIAVITAGVSYVQAKKMKKRVEDETRGVEANIESTSKEIPVIYGERRVGGVRPYITTEYDYNDNLYMVLVLGEGEIDSVSDIRIDDIPITDERFRVGGVDENPNFWYELKTGAVDQTASDLLKQGASYSIRTDLITQSTRDKYKDQHFQTSSDGNTYFYPWHDNHKLSGVAYLALKFKYDQNAYSGIPDVTCLVKGKKVYDPRKDSTIGGTGDHRADDQTTWEWSENPALCIRDYLLNDIYGKGLPVTAIDDASFIKSANDCDTFTVTPYQDAPEDQKLFEMNAVVDTGKKILDNLVDMLVSCRGFIPYQNGKYSLIIDQVGSSVFDVQADHIISGISIAGTKKEDRFNQVKINFFNKDYNYKEDQAIYPESDSELYTTLLAEDEGESLVEDLDIFSIDNFYSARDIARLVLERSRKNMTIQFTATSELINVNVTDVISITHPTPEWTAKLFQVQEITLKFDGTVDLTCIEYDADLYTYDEPEEQQPYIGSLLPDPNTVQPIETLTTSKGVYIQNDGQSVGYIDVTWDLPDNQLITRYDVKHVHNGVTDVVNVATNSYRIMPTQDGQNYTISVRAVNALGVTSAWITATAVASSVDTTAPADITGGSVTGGLNQLTLSWTNPSDNDFDLVKIKVGDDNNVNNAIELASTRSDTFIHDINTYETTKYYWGAPVDRTGNVGNYVSIGSATTGRPSYDDLNDKPEIPVVPEVATTAYLTLSDSNAPTDTEFNTAVGRDPIENDFVVVSYEALVEGETVTKTKAYVYKTVPPAEVPDWTEVTEYIDGSMIVTGSLSASDITTGTLNAKDVTISNLTIGYGSVTDTPTIPSTVSELTNDTGFVTSVAWNELTGTAPAVSTFNNDSSFITLDNVPSNPQWWSLSGRDDTTAPTDADFNTAFSRNPVKGDVLLITDTGGDTANYQYSGTAWTSISALIRGDMLVQGTVNADRIEVDGTSASVTIDGDTGTPILVQSDGSTVFSVSDSGDVTMNGAYISGIPVTAIPTFESDVRAVVGAVTVDALVVATPATYTEQDFPDNLLSSLKILDTGQSAYASDYSYNLVLRIDDSWTYEYTSEEDKQGGQDLYYFVEGYNSVTEVYETVLSVQSYTTPVFYKLPRGGNPQELYVIDITETVTNIPSYYTGFRVWFRGVDKSQDHFANFEFEPYMTVKSGSSGFIPEDISVTSGTATGGGSLTYDNQGEFTFSPADVSSFVTQTDIDNSITSLVDSAPATLDTLNELAAALGDDANFAQTTATALGTKMPKTGGTFSGAVTAPSFIGKLQGAATGAPDATIWCVSGQYDDWGIFYNEATPDRIEFRTDGTTTCSIALDNGDISTSGTLTASGYNDSNWNTAYTYSQVGHLPLSGGTLTGSLNFSNVQSRDKIDFNGGDAHNIGWESYHNTYGPNTWDSGFIAHKFYANTDTTIAVIGTGGDADDGNINSEFYGNVDVTGTISASGYNDSNWNTAYTYSQVGHLPLTGGTLSGVLTANSGAKLVIQDTQNGGSGRGIYMYTKTDTNWVQYMAESGTGKAPDGGDACAGLDGTDSWAFRFRVWKDTTAEQSGFIFENSNNEALMQISGSTGKVYTKDSLYSGKSITIGTGGDYNAGTIYSDENWGMIFRARQDSPANANFLWSDSDDNHIMRIDGGRLTLKESGSKLAVTNGATIVSGVNQGNVSGLFQKGASDKPALFIGNESGKAHTWFSYTNGSNYITADGSGGDGKTYIRHSDSASTETYTDIASFAIDGISLTKPLSTNSNITTQGQLNGDTIALNNDATNTSRHRISVYDSASVSYGMMLWNTNGTSGEWSTMIYGPNQASRRISFGKVNGSTFTNHSHVTELAYIDLDDGKYHGKKAKYVFSGGTLSSIQTLSSDNYNYINIGGADSYDSGIIFSEGDGEVAENRRYMIGYDASEDSMRFYQYYKGDGATNVGSERALFDANGNFRSKVSINVDRNSNSDVVNSFINTNTGTSAYSEISVDNSSDRSYGLRLGSSQNYSNSAWQNSWVYSTGSNLKLASDEKIEFYVGGGLSTYKFGEIKNETGIKFRFGYDAYDGVRVGQYLTFLSNDSHISHNLYYTGSWKAINDSFSASTIRMGSNDSDAIEFGFRPASAGTTSPTYHHYFSNDGGASHTKCLAVGESSSSGILNGVHVRANLSQLRLRSTIYNSLTSILSWAEETHYCTNGYYNNGWYTADHTSNCRANFRINATTTSAAGASWSMSTDGVFNTWNRQEFVKLWNIDGEWEGNVVTNTFKSTAPHFTVSETLEIGDYGSSWGHPYISMNSGWSTGSYPTLGSKGGTAGSLIMLHNPHLPSRTDNKIVSANTSEAHIRCALDTSASGYVDFGTYDNGSTKGGWIRQNGSADATILYSKSTSGDTFCDNNLRPDEGNLIIGDGAYSSSASYVGMKTAYQSGTNDYMIISGISDGNTYVSAKDGSQLVLRGGGNNTTNQIEIFDGTTITATTSNFTSTGNITAYSDINLKDNITNIDNALEKVNSIRGVTYDRIDQDNARHAGVIAQEVEQVLPEVVHTNDDGIKSVAYGNMVGLLIQAIKEQQQQIEQLKSEIEVIKDGNN